VEIVRIDYFEPDYETACEVCGEVPTVTAIKNGKVFHHTGVCGVCCWGQAECVDPGVWNEPIDD
jgi:hypothetical protein